MKFNSVIKKALGIAALAGAMVLGTAVKSEAALVAYICNTATCSGTQGVDWFGVADGGTGDGLAGTPGAIIATGSFTGLTVLVNTSQSKPAIGSAGSPQMDLNFTVTGIGQVWMYAADNDFTGLTSLTGALNGNWGGTASIQACIYGGTNNVLGTLAAPACTATLTSSPINTTLTHPGGLVSPYALTLGVHIIRSTAGSTMTGDFLVVPEPATMALFGLGLVGLGYASRRRRRQ